jgi:hypothetical protein
MQMLGGNPNQGGERTERPAPQRSAPPTDDFADDDILF